jgi:hypothetical protein
MSDEEQHQEVHEPKQEDANATINIKVGYLQDILPLGRSFLARCRGCSDLIAFDA